MNIRKNARPTPLGRERIVMQMSSGQRPEAVARVAGVCPRTVRKWAARNVAAGSLSDLLEKMEREASEGVWQTLDADLQRVRDECARVREYMQAEA